LPSKGISVFKKKRDWQKTAVKLRRRKWPLTKEQCGVTRPNLSEKAWGFFGKKRNPERSKTLLEAAQEKRQRSKNWTASGAH